MNVVFPLDQSGATSLYTTLYVLTFALHQALMHYVLAGILVMAWSVLFPGQGLVPRSRQPLAELLRDWMPFFLGAAITAGVAPLLFVQILYARAFYTANLLLGWRWMVVIPVLIVVFYLLYEMKTASFTERSGLVQKSVALLAGAGIVFVGFCWTANHLLSTREGRWPEVYATGALGLAAAEVVPRMLVWLGGAFVSLAVIAGWQLHHSLDEAETESSARLLGWLALGGLDVFLLSGLYMFWHAGAEVSGLLWGIAGGPYLVLIAVGLVLLYGAWLVQWHRRRLLFWMMVSATVGWLTALLATSAVRELVRQTKIDMATVAAQHEEAAQIGGLGVFLVFAFVNFVAIAVCVMIVRRGRKAERERA